MRKTQIAANVWDEGAYGQGITDDSIYQVVSLLRRELRHHAPNKKYIVTWSGKPEGGYRFFPTGNPEDTHIKSLPIIPTDEQSILRAWLEAQLATLDLQELTTSDSGRDKPQAL